MNKSINVCLLNDSFPPVIDGVANAVLNYARIIQNGLGNAVVVTPNYPDATDDYSFPVVRYPSIKVPKTAGYRMGLPINGAVREIKKHNIDIIHSHCPLVSALVSKSMRSAIKAPVIMTYHTKFDIDIANTFESELMQLTAIKFIVSNIEACDEVWAVSSGAGENLRALGYRGDYRVMHNGVDFPKARSSDMEIQKINSLHSLSPDEPVFLFVGRMMWYKGIRIILDGLACAKASGTRFKMIFVGDGSDFGEIYAYTNMLGIEGDCIFTGAINDRETLRAYFSRADMFLFPSTYDTSGIVVREAAACGLASALIRGSSAADGIADGRSGVLIDENPKSLAWAVINAAKNRDSLKAMGRHAMDELYMSWEDSVKQAYERYQVVLETFSAKQRAQKKKLGA